LFRRLGPYHHARLNAAGKMMEIFGVEACGMDDTYAWEKVEGATSFTRMTLTDRHVEDRSWRRELRRQMWQALGRIKPRAVVVPGWSYTDALSALSWCLQTNTPVVIMSESTEWDEPRLPWKEWMKRRLVRLCSAALAGGTPHRDYLVRLGMPAERVFLGYDAVENEHFACGAKEVRGQRSEVRVKPQSGNAASSGPVVSGPVVRGQFSALRARYGLPEKYFLASARFVEKKNLPRLLEAYALYRQKAESTKQKGEGTEAEKQKAENKNKFQLSEFQLSAFKNDLCPPTSVPWSLVLLGDGPLRSTLNSQLSTLNLQHSVLLPGFKQYDELPVYYALASAFVHASTTEQWGLVVNEAMASGLPVLVSNRCGCAQDLVKDGVNGFTFDPVNVEQLAALMLRLTETTEHGSPTTRAGTTDHGLRTTQPKTEVNLEDMGKASREIISNWGPERFASGLKSAVKKALEVGPKRAGITDRLLLRVLLAR